jgi:hypothetical protein
MAGDRDQEMTILIQRTWASVIGLASTTIGILKFCSIVQIPTLNALIHIITGIMFIAGAWVNRGRYISNTNRWLGIFYVVFGAIGVNWAHIIVGFVSVTISFICPTKATNRWELYYESRDLTDGS